MLSHIVSLRIARTGICPLVVALTLTMPLRVSADELTPGQFFLSKVKPLLDHKCGSCHGKTAKEIEGGFDLRTREAMFKGGESGDPGIDLKQPNESSLLRAIRWKDGLEMPPKENDRLTEEQIKLVETWVKKGAAWPTKADIKNWTNESADGVIVETSGGQSESWTNRRYKPEDLWSYQPLKKVAVPWASHPKGQQANPIDAFVVRRLDGLSTAPQAEPRVLARRLSYTLTGLPDESGEGTIEQKIDRLLKSPHYGERMAQHWLDVVRYADSNGFSRDDFRPDAHRYRSYVIQAFNDDKPYRDFIREQIAGDELGIAGQEAVSFLWMGPWEHTAMSVAKVTRQQWLDDVTNSIGVTFLGQQLRCAKCHDHKFDPIPTRDYYSFQAIFSGTEHHKKAGSYQIAAKKFEPISILQGGSLDSPTDRVQPNALSLLASTARHQYPVSEESKPRAALAEWIANPRNPLTSRVIVNRVWQMHFGRGLVATSNDFGKMGADPTHPELLDWLAGWFIENGWSIKKLHRLILSSETYQRSTQHPEPELLAKRDPTNQLLSVFPSRRLTAEEIRDSMLAISGELNRKQGGPSIYPEINWEVAFQPRLLMGKIAPPYEPSQKRSDRNRRSVYCVRIRNLGHPFMEVMNRPGSDLSCDRRDETTVAPQAFTMLHGEFVHERALALADLVAKEHNGPADHIQTAFQRVYGRDATAAEVKLATKYLEKAIALHRKHKVEKQELPTEIELAEVAERTGKTSMKKFKLKNVANYEEDLKPWDVGVETRALADLCLVLLNSSEFLYVY